jgi:phosphatidylglycerol:prolipoprotein diacylglycerol transferase
VFVSVLAELRWPILERIPIAGDFAVSPHGISIAIGFLVGAQVMLKRAEKRGIARRHVEGVDLHIQSLLTRAAIGAILGARFFYIVTRPDQFPDPLEWFKIWEGGLSLLGGLAGGIGLAIPYVVRRRFSVPLLLDSAAPGLALGIFLGRIGDLVIGEHLGGETSFVLGWRCTGAFRDPVAPYPFPGPSPATVQGCFDATLHQTALYDFLAGGIIFAILLILERRPRFDGFFMLAFGVLYGLGRFVTDFARAADKDLVGPLTGSQVTALATIAAIVVWYLVRRPDRRVPYAWSPPDFAQSWGDPSDESPTDLEPVESEEVGNDEVAGSDPDDEGYPSRDG